MHFQVRIVNLLLQQGADVHAKDKGGLVPLHNACSYGHYEVNFIVGQFVHKIELLLLRFALTKACVPRV